MVELIMKRRGRCGNPDIESITERLTSCALGNPIQEGCGGAVYQETQYRTKGKRVELE